MEFNERLRIYFDNKGLSQKELVDILGYEKTYLNKYFNNREPNWEFLSRLVKSFPDIDMNFLIKGIEVDKYVNGKDLECIDKTRAFLEDIEKKISNFKESMAQK